MQRELTHSTFLKLCQVIFQDFTSAVPRRPHNSPNRIYIQRLLLAQSGHYSLQSSFCRQLTQSSSTRPGTLSNSRVLFVTSTAPAAMACPAMAVSFGPIRVPASRSATRMTTRQRRGDGGGHQAVHAVDLLEQETGEAAAAQKRD